MMMKLIFILVTMGVATYGQKCGERQYLHNGLCCDMCRPGQYVKKHCSASNYTTCELCQVGTIMRTYNEKSECDSCGYLQYFDINILFCMDCRACPKGQYPVEKCSTLLNTRCLECPEDHYSNITANYNFTCIPCTACKKYIRQCTAEQDAVCMSAEEPQTTKMPTVPNRRKKLIVPKLTTEKTSPVNDERSTKRQDNTFLILAIVLSIVVLLTLLVIYWCAIAKRKSRCQGGDRFYIIPRGLKYEPLRTGLLLRNQPASFFLKLVDLLTPDGRPNWKDLAANFNDFTYDEIANFAVDKSTAAEKMLCAWQTKNTSTVDRLHHCLVSIKRDDVATYVADFVTGATDTPV